MNKNLTPILLIILALGVYFTFTRTKLDELAEVKAINDKYSKAISNSKKIVSDRDKIRDTYNKISLDDRENLNKMLPDNVDNVRLIIDVTGVAGRHGLALKGLRTSADASTNKAGSSDIKDKKSNTNNMAKVGTYDTVTLSFSVKAGYQVFIDFMKDLESSLRIIDISKITLTATDTGVYEYGVEVKTYWLGDN